ARSRFANLDKLYGLIRELEATGAPASAVVAQLSEQAWNDDDSVQSRDEPEHDAVRITSIFKAKGLEAPVVVLAHNQRRTATPSVVIDRATHSYTLSVSGSLKPQGWKALYDAEKARFEEERERWMYVAATRARDHLVIPRVDGASGCLTASWLSGGLPEGEHDSVVAVADGADVWVRQSDDLPPPPTIEGPYGDAGPALRAALEAGTPEVDSAGVEWEARRGEAIRRSVKACPRFRTATQAAHTSRVPREATGIGALGGRVLHDVLDHLDLQQRLEQRLAGADELLPQLASDHGLPTDRLEPCRAALERVLRHDVFARIERAPEVWKEIPFAFQERGQHVHGIIDCCFPTDERRTDWVVVDWKSDLPPPGSPARANYERQVQVYARALLATVTPCERVEALLVGPHDELGTPSAAEQALEVVDSRLRPVLDALLAEGVAVPEVGVEWEGGLVELRWTDPELAVLVDSDPDFATELRDAGWDVLEATTDDL
ncbi:MAG: PD-(D/E)XK nuclease family protein, partial [Myxococcales bacterium]|nr:PD-(D/E)XK nuclease family protein [Myxococcales bacterium]